MIGGKHIVYTIEEHGSYYKITAHITLAVDKIVDRSYVLNYDEAIDRRNAEEELDQKIFDGIYGDLYHPVRKLRWWVSKNCANNLLLLDALNMFNDVLKLLRMKND